MEATTERLMKEGRASALKEKAGLPDIKLHELRHTAASMMAAQGVRVESRRLSQSIRFRLSRLSVIGSLAFSATRP